MQGWLLLPLTAHGKIPLVTIVHGGPAAAAVPYFPGPGLLTALTRTRLGRFYPNPRGSFGQGEALHARQCARLRLRRPARYPRGHRCGRACRADRRRRGSASPAAATAGTWPCGRLRRPTASRPPSPAAGISDWQSYYGENGIDDWMMPYFGASVYDDPAVYARSSPIDTSSNVKTPTFVYVGERDIECPAPQTQEFWHALKTLGVPTAIMIYPGEGHGLRDPTDARDALERTLAWFDKYLK